VNDSEHGSDWPEWPKPRRGKVPDSLWRYHERLKQILGTDGPSLSEPSRVYQLPPSVHELARRGEESKEFAPLIRDLYELGGLERAEVYDFLRTYGDDGAQIWRGLNDLLRRSGYYQAVIAGEPPEEYFQRIADRVQYGCRQFSRFWLLDGCSFPRDSFELAGFSVVKPSTQELISLGPAPHIAERFFPDENLDAESYSRFWFLKRQDDIRSGYVSHQRWSEKKATQPESAADKLLREQLDEIVGKDDNLADPSPTQAPDRSPSSEEFPERVLKLKYLRAEEIARGTYIHPELAVGRRHWFGEADGPAVPLLILSLYSHKFFDVPSAFIAESGWRLWWIKRGRPHGDQSGRPYLYRSSQSQFQISENQWERFEEFARLAASGLAALRLWRGDDAGFANKFHLAAERYFRATFATARFWMSTFMLDESVSDIDFLDSYDLPQAQQDTAGISDEVLLQYVFALEALLFNDKDKEESLNNKRTQKKISIARKFRSRLAGIVGRDTRERRWIEQVALQLYKVRSCIAHGDETENYPDFVVTRRLCQCAAGILLLLSSDVAKSQGIGEIIYNLSSTEWRKRKEALALVSFARRRFYELVAEPERFDDPKVIDIRSSKRS
jgi:hypothetical protein